MNDNEANNETSTAEVLSPPHQSQRPHPGIALRDGSTSFSIPISPSITLSLFHSKLKTYLFGKSFPHISLTIDI